LIIEKAISNDNYARRILHPMDRQSTFFLIRRKRWPGFLIMRS